MSKRDQEKEELYVFEQFTRVCPYNLDFSSAIKLDPPEPDIMCKSYNNKTYYFELMQLIDENLSKIFNNALRLQEDLSESLKSLEKERATKIDQKYKGSIITILLPPDYNYRNNKLLKEKLFYLLELPEDHHGKLSLRDKPELFRLGVEISVDKILKNGLEFNVPIFHWNRPEIFDAFKRKLRKRYKRKSELIAYYEIQNVNKILMQETLYYAQKDLASSFFLRLWLFSSWTETILEVYPMI